MTAATVIAGRPPLTSHTLTAIGVVTDLGSERAGDQIVQAEESA